jgi:hypothetical protein
MAQTNGKNTSRNGRQESNQLHFTGNDQYFLCKKIYYNLKTTHFRWQKIYPQEHNKFIQNTRTHFHHEQKRTMLKSNSNAIIYFAEAIAESLKTQI